MGGSSWWAWAVPEWHVRSFGSAFRKLLVTLAHTDGAPRALSQPSFITMTLLKYDDKILVACGDDMV